MQINNDVEDSPFLQQMTMMEYVMRAIQERDSSKALSLLETFEKLVDEDMQIVTPREFGKYSLFETKIWILRNRMGCYQMCKQFEKAISTAMDILQLVPEYTDEYIEKFSSVIFNTNEALDHLSTMYLTINKDLELGLKYCNLLEQRIEAVNKRLSQGIKSDEYSHLKEQQIQNLTKRATIYRMYGKYQEAVENLSQILSIDPTHYNSFLSRAELYILLYRETLDQIYLKKALEDAKIVHQASSGDTKRFLAALLIFLQSDLHLNQIGDVISNSTQLLNNIDYSGARALRAAAYYRYGEMEKSLADFQTIESMSTVLYEFCDKYCNVLLHFGQYDEAVSVATTCTENMAKYSVTVKNMRGYLELVGMYTKFRKLASIGKYTEAYNLFRDNILPNLDVLYVDHQPDIWLFHYGIVLLHLGKYDEAIDVSNMMDEKMKLDIFSNSFESMILHATALAYKGNFELSDNIFKQSDTIIDQLDTTVLAVQQVLCQWNMMKGIAYMQHPDRLSQSIVCFNQSLQYADKTKVIHERNLIDQYLLKSAK
jgi:tetratricopeptide (TPR) repeat protein